MPLTEPFNQPQQGSDIFHMHACDRDGRYVVVHYWASKGDNASDSWMMVRMERCEYGCPICGKIDCDWSHREETRNGNHMD